jgi:P-type Cu+ transporter
MHRSSRGTNREKENAMSTPDPLAGQSHVDHEMAEGHAGTTAADEPTATDPVCGMTVSLKSTTRTESFGHEKFHFCSEKCQTKFKADPWFYASSTQSPT